MLRKTLNLCPRMDKNYDEVKHVGRRMQLYPSRDPFVCRSPNYVDRFREVGPATSRVWLSLGNQMRRRRVGRDRDWLDKRFYWRPIPRQTQNTYLRLFRRINHSWRGAPVRRLFPNAFEIGSRTVGPMFDGDIKNKYGAEFAAPMPFDWEYRVY